MKNNKKIMLSLAMVAIIAVAAIGIGYAYTATTSNTGNNVSTEYIVINPSVDGTTPAYSGAINTNIQWNTENNGGTVTYTLANTITGGVLDGYQQTNTFYLKVNPTGVSDNTTFNLTVKGTNGVDFTNYQYMIVFGAGISVEAADTDAGIANPSSVAASHAVAFENETGAVYSPTTPMSITTVSTVSMTLFVKPKVTITGTVSQALSAATLQFVLEHNPVTALAVEGGSTVDLTTSSNPVEKTIIITPAGATDKRIEATSGNNNIATVVASNNVVTITPQAAGSTTVTVSAADGSGVQTIITVNVTTAV